MDAQPATPYVPPSPRIPKTLGVLNLVIGGFLLLMGGCCAFSQLYSPFLMKGIAEETKKSQARDAGARKARIEDLARREKTAQTEEDRQNAKSERERLEAEADEPDPFSAMQTQADPKVTAFFVVKLAVGLILDTLLMVAGVGLIRLSGWGRRLSLWVSGLKILTLLAFNVVMVLALTPVMARQAADSYDMVIELQRRQAARTRTAPPPMVFQRGQLAQLVAVYVMVYGGAEVVLGSIYPALSLWLLNLAGARAACTGRKRGPGPGWEAP